MEASKLFGLEPVKTDLTDSAAQALAAKSIDTSARDAGVVNALTSFSGAFKNLVKNKTDERVREDVKIAKNAAVREKVMPGGLLPRAQQAFRDTQDIVTSNKVQNEVDTFMKGQGVQALINDPVLESEGKIRQLDATLDSFYLEGGAGIGNAKTLLELKAYIDKQKLVHTEDIYKVERDLSYGVTLEGINGKIKQGMDSEFSPRDIFADGKWIQAQSKKAMEIHPWLAEDPDETKLATFRMLTENEDMLMSPEVIDMIMTAPFSKGTTWGGLKAGTTDTGKEIDRIYKAFHLKAKQNHDEMDRAEREGQVVLDAVVDDGGVMDEFMDANKDDPDRNVNALQIMSEQYGVSGSAQIAFIRRYNTKEAFAQQGPKSMAYSDTEDAVIDDVIQNERDLAEWVAAENLSDESYKLLKRIMTDKNSTEKEHIRTFKEAVKSTTGVVTGVLKGLVKTPHLDTLIAAMASGHTISDSALQTAALSGKSVMKPKAYMAVMMQLQGKYKAFNEKARKEAEMAVRENRPLNVDEIANDFMFELSDFVAQVEQSKGPVGPAKGDSKDTSGGTVGGTDTADKAEKVVVPNPDGGPNKGEKEQIVKTSTGTSEDKVILAGSLGDSITLRERSKLSEVRSSEEQKALDEFKDNIKKGKETNAKELEMTYESVLSSKTRADMIDSNTEAQGRQALDQVPDLTPVAKREMGMWEKFKEFLFPGESLGGQVSDRGDIEGQFDSESIENEEAVSSAVDRVFPDAKNFKAALMSSIKAETGNFSSTIEEDGGEGIGLIQFTGPQRTAFEKYLKDRNVENTADSTMDYLRILMTGSNAEVKSYHDIGAGNRRKMRSLIRVGTPEEISDFLTDKVIRPFTEGGSKRAEQRDKRRQATLDRLKDN